MCYTCKSSSMTLLATRKNMKSSSRDIWQQFWIHRPVQWVEEWRLQHHNFLHQSLSSPARWLRHHWHQQRLSSPRPAEVEHMEHPCWGWGPLSHHGCGWRLCLDAGCVRDGCEDGSRHTHTPPDASLKQTFVISKHLRNKPADPGTIWTSTKEPHMIRYLKSSQVIKLGPRRYRWSLTESMTWVWNEWLKELETLWFWQPTRWMYSVDYYIFLSTQLKWKIQSSSSRAIYINHMYGKSVKVKLQVLFIKQTKYSY